tara:strand:+ start:204 stop:545 length:342 start_codon:yes stop_codon:yes gene_type:complete
MAIPTKGISTEINLYFINKVVQKIKKNPILDPIKSLLAPDLTETLAKNKIIPIVNKPEPIRYLRICATSIANLFSIISGNIVMLIWLLKIKKHTPINIITRPFNAKMNRDLPI